MFYLYVGVPFQRTQGVPFQRAWGYRFSVDNFLVHSTNKGVAAETATPLFFNDLRRKRVPFQHPSEEGIWRCAGFGGTADAPGKI
jgi:hypothetical protein